MLEEVATAEEHLRRLRASARGCAAAPDVGLAVCAERPRQWRPPTRTESPSEDRRSEQSSWPSPRLFDVNTDRQSFPLNSGRVERPSGLTGCIPQPLFECADDHRPPHPKPTGRMGRLLDSAAVGRRDRRAWAGRGGGVPPTRWSIVRPPCRRCGSVPHAHCRRPRIQQAAPDGLRGARDSYARLTASGPRRAPIGIWPIG